MPGLTKEQRSFEAAMQLRDLKVGDVIDDRRMKAIDFFIGGLLEAARKIPMQKMTIDFASGEPKLTENTTGIGVSVNGKEL